MTDQPDAPKGKLYKLGYTADGMKVVLIDEYKPPVIIREPIHIGSFLSWRLWVGWFYVYLYNAAPESDTGYTFGYAQDNDGGWHWYWNLEDRADSA